MTINQWVTSSGLPQKEAAALVHAVCAADTKLDAMSFYLAKSTNALTDMQLKQLDSWKKRRLAFEPMAHILGISDFRGLHLKVGPGALIPRQETEELVELVIDHIKESINDLRIAEIGTGCGAIALSLLDWSMSNGKQVDITATDISQDALKIAKENLKIISKFNIQHSKLTLVSGNLLEPIVESVDIIIANLPYIPSHWLETLDSSVKNYEPEVALDGGEDGLTLIKAMLKDAPRVLKPNGLIFLEIWHEHEVKDFAEFTQFETKIHKDSFGRNRFAVLALKS